ncbi:MAG TPA: hypothetical protein VMR06_17930 [Dokdonella sp.]|nr:hypothetical protein [Dokdonella sp.]HUD43869.1 hypothetical protein [Dokdonella sp.]
MSARRIAIGVAVLLLIAAALGLWARHGGAIFLSSLGAMIC